VRPVTYAATEVIISETITAIIRAEMGRHNSAPTLVPAEHRNSDCALGSPFDFRNREEDTIFVAEGECSTKKDYAVSNPFFHVRRFDVVDSRNVAQPEAIWLASERFSLPAPPHLRRACTCSGARELS